MDWLAMKKKGEEFFKKYKFVPTLFLLHTLYIQKALSREDTSSIGWGFSASDYIIGQSIS